MTIRVMARRMVERRLWARCKAACLASLAARLRALLSLGMARHPTRPVRTGPVARPPALGSERHGHPAGQR